MTRREFVGSVIALMAAWLVGRKSDLRRMLAGLREIKSRKVPPGTVFYVDESIYYDYFAAATSHDSAHLVGLTA